MTASTELVASVEIAHEARSERIPPGTGNGPVLRVVAGDAVRVAALIGKDPELARAAARGTLAGGADLVALVGTHDGRDLIERATLLREARPDLVLVLAGSGGDTNGLIDAAEAMRFGCAHQHPVPHVLVSADERARERIAAACAPSAVEALPDARIDAGHEALVARLRAVRRRAQSDVVLRDEALEAAARGLAARHKSDVVLIDVTGGATSVIHAAADGTVGGIHLRLGVGAAADRVVARAGLDRVRRWFPRAIEAPALLERVFNRALWPDAVPAAVLSLSLEMALAREVIAHALEEASRADVALAPLRAAPRLVLTGRLAVLPRAAQSLLVALDGLEPSGTTLVSRAADDALVVAGALASRGRAIPSPSPEDIALVVSLWPKRSAAVRISDANGSVEERVARGQLTLVPTKGAVEVAVQGSSARPRAEALGLGVVIDARGRPLALPPRDADRIPTLARWHSALDALPPEGR
ncbi:MAG TPA: hypothetical protein VGQ86_04340 [Candidatus Limnocylindria bacterium]|nr:hypothetical protein [Candidatus Limnocylindria bacterium]